MELRASLLQVVEQVIGQLDGTCLVIENETVDRLRSLFDLSTFEAALVVLCAGYAMTPAVSSRIGGMLTFGYAFEHLPEAHLDAAAPTRPLRRHGILNLASGFGTIEAPLSIDERVLSFMLGVETLDERILPHTTQVYESSGPLTPSQSEFVRVLASAVSQGQSLQVFGGDARGRGVLITAIAKISGRLPLWIRASSLLLSLEVFDLLQRLVEREVLLSGVLPVVDLDVDDSAEVSRSARLFANNLSVPIVVCAAEVLKLNKAATSFAVPESSAAERYALWDQVLPGRDRDAGALAYQFRLTPSQIQDIVSSARIAPSFANIWARCREAARLQLDDLAHRIEPRADWDTLVLAPSATAALHELVNQSNLRYEVHETWGLARGDRGKAITALFHGPSGTGKTHAAEVIARAVELDLIHVDLSQIVDKYVGETEKRIRRLFDTAERGGAVLLFDEADAIFGKRGNIERGTDRWANNEDRNISDFGVGCEG
ncbi:MAG: ATP-binding protein [Kofleriaceae bacterium]